MDLQKLYRKNAELNYTSEILMHKIKTEACNKIENEVNKKYENTSIIRDGIKYTFGYCKVDNWFNNSRKEKVNIHVMMISTSKNNTSYHKKEQEKELERFKKTARLNTWRKFKIPLWIDLNYTVSDIDKLKDDTNLDISQ